ncbi:MAG TPA: hypothetical protein VF221_06435 [Chloroflexota bacterium]
MCERRAALRQRYYVFVSVIYIVLGLIITVRSIVAHVVIIAVLGVVFLALGMIRLRDYIAWMGRRRE